MRPLHLVLAVSLLASSAACVEKGPKNKGKKIPQEFIEENLLSAAPAMKHKVNADLGGKVVYLGCDVDSDTIKPGGKVRIVHYWKVTSAPGSDWRVFAHVSGSSSKDWMNVDYTDMRHGYPAKKWKAGDIIRDEQKFALKKDWTTPWAQVSVGLYRKGGRSINDRMPVVSGPHDDQSRVKAFRFKVELGANAKAMPKPVGYVVRRASGPITIDGKADEADWKNAALSPKFTDAEGSPPTKQDTRARLLYDDKNLYVFVQAKDDDVYSQYKKNDSPMWKEDIIELFIDADRNRRGYVELQVNPNNAQFDAWFATTRAQKSDMAWTANMKSAVTVHGSLNTRGDKDSGWDVEIAIPLEAVKGRDDKMKVTLPPPVGTKWRLNVVRGDKPAKDRLRASSWNQITYSDFHALNRMTEVTFGDKQGRVTAAPPIPGVKKLGAGKTAPKLTRPPENPKGKAAMPVKGGKAAPKLPTKGAPQQPAKPVKKMPKPATGKLK
jgi:hypothetical protein